MLFHKSDRLLLKSLWRTQVTILSHLEQIGTIMTTWQDVSDRLSAGVARLDSVEASVEKLMENHKQELLSLSSKLADTTDVAAAKANIEKMIQAIDTNATRYADLVAKNTAVDSTPLSTSTPDAPPATPATEATSAVAGSPVAPAA